jgi:uncharacterized protein (TIGR03435 family)
MKLAICVLLLANVVAHAAPARHAGDLPSALVWDKLKGDCPASLDWASLQGKVVVIAFRDLFPGIAEWKSLTEKFRGQSAIFLLVSTGSEFLLDQEVTQNSYLGCILIDEGKTNARDFGSPAYQDPTVVIDDRGFIAGWAVDGVDGVDTAVGALLKHKIPSDLAESVDPEKPQSSERETRTGPPSLAVQISLAVNDQAAKEGSIVTTYAQRVMSFGSGRFVATNQSLRSIICFLWETPAARVSFPEELDIRKYDVIANMPLSDDVLVRTLVQEAIENRFGLRIEKETRSMRVYALTAARSSSPYMQPSKEGSIRLSTEGEGLMKGTAAEIEDIASEFEHIVEAPVIDQTGVKGQYDYFVSSKLPGAEAAFDMANQLGLKLTRIEQPMEMLVVTAQQVSPK